MRANKPQITRSKIESNLRTTRREIKNEITVKQLTVSTATNVINNSTFNKMHFNHPQNRHGNLLVKSKKQMETQSN